MSWYNVFIVQVQHMFQSTCPEFDVPVHSQWSWELVLPKTHFGRQFDDGEQEVSSKFKLKPLYTTYEAYRIGKNNDLFCIKWASSELGINKSFRFPQFNANLFLRAHRRLKVSHIFQWLHNPAFSLRTQNMCVQIYLYSIPSLFVSLTFTYSCIITRPTMTYTGATLLLFPLAKLPTNGGGLFPTPWSMGTPVSPLSPVSLHSFIHTIHTLRPGTSSRLSTTKRPPRNSWGRCSSLCWSIETGVLPPSPRSWTIPTMLVETGT